MIIAFFIILVCLSVLIFFATRENAVHKYMLFLFLGGFTVYSGIGIVLYRDTDQWLYLLEFSLFCLLFIATGLYSMNHQASMALSSLDNVVNNHTIIMTVLALIYPLTFLYPFFAESISLHELFNVRMLFINYAATPFALRLSRRADPIYVIVTNQIRSISAPFFYLYLYKLRKKPVRFILLYVIPINLKMVADGYLSRNNMAVYATFLVVYLIMEGYLSKKLAILLGTCAIPVVLSMFTVLANVRQGGTLSFSFAEIKTNIQSLIESECSFPVYYDYCAAMTSFSQTVNFFIYMAIVCIPSALYSLIGFEVPNLAYSFTETVLGMGYGARDYYIVLPSVLGEAIILFGTEFAWIYAGFYGLIVHWFLRVLSSYDELKYLRLFFMLDFFRQFRGGSQYVLSSWMTMLLPMIVIVFILDKCEFTWRDTNVGGE